MRIIGYVRLSRASREESTSIERQRELIVRTCEARGFELVDTVEDIDVSATRSRLDRPGLDMLRRRIAAGDADAVLVWRLDRLVRSVVDVGILLDEGLHIISATESLDTTTPMGRAMVEILQVFAAMEAKTIGVRVSASQEHLRKVGRFAGGVVPYGYSAIQHPEGVGRALAVDPIEAAIVRRMADEVLGGASVYAVTERLNADGIPPRRPVKKHADGSTSVRGWNPSSVKRILRSNTVLGRVKARGELLRDADGIPTVIWEPILAVEEVERLRALTDWAPTPGRSEATKVGQRKRASRLLSGMIACATCGAPLIAKSRHTTGRPVYSCDAKARGRVCGHAITVEAERVEAEVERRFLDAVGHMQMVEAHESQRDIVGLAEVEEAIRHTTDELRSPSADVAALVDRLTRLRTERDRLDALPPDRTVELVRTGETFTAAWARLDMYGRRQAILRSGVVIGVAPASRRGFWDPNRVTVEWHGESEAALLSDFAD